MKTEIDVCLGNSAVDVGRLSFEARGNRQIVTFVYHESWLKADNAFALSPDLPLGPGYFFGPKRDGSGSVFFGCLSDVEPDGWGRAVIKRDHAKQRKAQSKARNNVPALLSDIDYLLWVSDFSRMGAIRFRDQNGAFLRPPGSARETPALLALPQLLSASKAFELNKETARDLAFLRGNGTSLGGLRPKCSILDSDGSLAIGKFPSVGDTRSVVHGEVLALQLAELAGIDVAAARVVDAAGVPVAVIRRFDREGALRMMYLSARSLMQASHAQQYTYLDIAETIRANGSHAQRDLTELWRRLVFNVLINNVDDHLNNHGFLHTASGQWRLAPAFDLNPFPDKERALKTWISDHSGEDASLTETMAVSGSFGLNQPAARAILEEVRDAVSGWKGVARSIGMTSEDIETYRPAFEYSEP